MDIAVALNVHKDQELILDTLESIHQWMSNKIFVVIDEAYYNELKNIKYKEAVFEKGYYHNCSRCPYKNVALSLKRVYELWPKCHWYCYIEYDCLVTSRGFLDELKNAQKNNVWVLANDVRHGGRLPPLVSEIFGHELSESCTILGCCVFYHHDFIQKINEGFIDRFLTACKDFQPGCFPGFYGYALEEELFPTLAKSYGGNVEELAGWNHNVWRGKYFKYPMRFPNTIPESDITAKTSIVHPLKEYNNPIRSHYREIRKKIQNGRR